MENVTQKGGTSKKGVTSKVVFCAIDLHDKSMLAGIAIGDGAVSYRGFNTVEDQGVSGLIKYLHVLRGESPAFSVWVCYEASGSGFRLADLFEEQGFRVSVLAPSHLPASQKSRSQKTDKLDVKRIMDVVRGHALAGGALPQVWIPDFELRDHREVVRHRFRLGEEVTKVKNKIHGLLKRNGIRKPEGMENWSKAHLAWLQEQVESSMPGCGFSLSAFLRELCYYREELKEADGAVLALSRTDRYRDQVKALTSIPGVGVLTAMVFSTELGFLGRFPNRRTIASYLGLVPRSFESGEQNDRKGHISRLGPYRVCKLLNQAAWVMIQHDPGWGAWFAERTRSGKKRDRKRMITAVMRHLAIMMWRRGLEAGALI